MVLTFFKFNGVVAMVNWPTLTSSSVGVGASEELGLPPTPDLGEFAYNM